MTKQDWDKILIEYALKHPDRYLGKEVAKLVVDYLLTINKHHDIL